MPKAGGVQICYQAENLNESFHTSKKDASIDVFPCSSSSSLVSAIHKENESEVDKEPNTKEKSDAMKNSSQNSVKTAKKMCDNKSKTIASYFFTKPKQ